MEYRYLVGEEVEVQSVLFEHILEEGDDLEGQDILPTVVTHLCTALRKGIIISPVAEPEP